MVSTILDPLVSTEQIVDQNGQPTVYFMRKWNEQRGVNADIPGDLTGIVFAAGTGLDGGGVLGTDDPITYTLADTAVTPGTYGDADNVAQVTVDQQGRITAIADVEITGGGGGGGSGNYLWQGDFTVATAGDAFIDFPLDEAYDLYRIIVRGQQGASTAEMQAIMSKDGGATFENAAADYKNANSTSDTNIGLSGGSTVGTGRAYVCAIDLFVDHTGTLRFSLTGTSFAATSSGGVLPDLIGGMPNGFPAPYAIDFMRVQTTAGDLDDITVSVYAQAKGPPTNLPAEIFHRANTGSINTFGAAIRGQITDLNEDITVTAMSAIFDPGQTPSTYQGMICVLTGTTVDAVYKTVAEEITGTAVNGRRFDFADPVILTAGQRIAVVIALTSGIGTTAVRPQFSGEWVGWGFDNTSPGLIVEQQATDIAVTDVLSTGNNDGSFALGLFLQTPAAVTAAASIQVREEQTTGTNGGSSSAGDQVRTLNTVVRNTITGASLASDQITLPAGTYKVNASAPAYDCNRQRTFLYNVTDAAVELLGTTGFSNQTGNVQARSFVIGEFTITSEKDFEIRQYQEDAVATFGLGVACSDGRVEIYSEATIEQIS